MRLFIYLRKAHKKLKGNKKSGKKDIKIFNPHKIVTIKYKNIIRVILIVKLEMARFCKRRIRKS